MLVNLSLALEIPENARVDRRIPKKLLVERGAPTAADKRQIAVLRAQAVRETQMNRRVELNFEIKRLEAVLAEAHAHL